jgi:hypothetical protein
MEHVVFFESPEGTATFRRFDTVEDAVGFVERLRNVDGVSDFSVYRLTPVPVTVRAYYRVEVPAVLQSVPTDGDGAAARAGTPRRARSAHGSAPSGEPEVPAEPDAAPNGEAALAEPVLPADDADAPGRRGLSFFTR